MLPWRLYFIVLILVTSASGKIKNKGWWRNKVFYQVFPRSFKDFDGDGIGDIKGITSRLQYFVDTGISAIWLSPIYRSPMIDSGYDITDFCDIDPMYGTIKDFEFMLKRAKELGIKVVMDFIPNHTSIKHQWFIKSVNSIGKYKDYYIWRRGSANNTKPPNNWIGVFGGPAWTYNEKRDLWYYHQFDYRQADLNYHNPNIENEMKKILYFWLKKGVDGFRVDAVTNLFENDDLLNEPRSYLPGVYKNEYRYQYPDFTTNDPRDCGLLAKWRAIVDRWTDYHNQEEKVMMTEVYALTINNIMKYYNYGSDVPFNFLFIMFANKTSTPYDYKKLVDDWMTSLPSGKSANWVTSNHDNPRAATSDPDKPDIKLALSLILPGVACVYYGDEIAMTDNHDITWEETQDPQSCRTSPNTYRNFSRDPCRTPFQWDETFNAGFSNATKTWLPVNKNHKVLNLESQKREPQSHYKLFKTLIKLKDTSDVLKRGSLIIEAINKNTVLLVLRRFRHEEVVLLVNFTNMLRKVNLRNYLPGALNATVIVSSVGSNFKWGSSLRISDLQLPPYNLIVMSSVTKQRH